MKNKYLRIALVVITLLVLAGGGYGLYRYFQPVKGLDKLPTDIRVSDAQLLADFEQDPVAAELKYKNKVLEISGTVSKIEADSAGGKVLFDKKGNFIIVAACTKESREKGASLEQNQAVLVKGVYTGYVVIDDMFLIPGEIKIDPCVLLP